MREVGESKIDGDWGVGVCQYLVRTNALAMEAIVFQEQRLFQPQYDHANSLYYPLYIFSWH